jgi:hypothetical protein
MGSLIAIKIGLLASALVMGSMAFFSAVVAPLVFARLEAAMAGQFLRALFPWYHGVVGIGGLAAAAALAWVRPVEAIVMAAVGIAALVLRQWLLPATQRHRDAAAAGNKQAQARFERLHRLSVGINALQFLGAVAVVARLGG